MIELGKPISLVPVLVAAFVGAILSACATGSPFSNASNLDQTFIAAAQTWDIDKSGSVTCAEWASYVSTLVRESDANGDNALDATEFAQMARTDRLFQEADLAYYDANSDSRVSVEELTGKQNRAFALLDKNGDCEIARNESVQVRGVDTPKPAQGTAPDSSGPSGRR